MERRLDCNIGSSKEMCCCDVPYKCNTSTMKQMACKCLCYKRQLEKGYLLCLYLI
jgi:hypothetical protein